MHDLIRPLLVCLAFFAGTVAVQRRNFAGNAAWIAVVAALLAAFGPAVGAYS